MRGEDGLSGGLFNYVNLEARVPAKRPLWAIQGIVNDALAGLSAKFQAQYSHNQQAEHDARAAAPDAAVAGLLLEPLGTPLDG
jgi:hypothetical protein